MKRICDAVWQRGVKLPLQFYNLSSCSHQDFFIDITYKLYFLEKEPSLMDTLMKVKKSGSEILSFSKTKQKFPPSSQFQAIPSTPEPQYTPVDLGKSYDGLERIKSFKFHFKSEFV